MHRQLDIVRLGPAGDLARLGKATGDAEIDARVVDPFLLDQLPELPLGAELLARRQRHRSPRAQRLERVRVLGAQRVLHEEGADRLRLLTEPDGIGQVEARVDVKADLDLVAHCLPYRVKLLDRCEHRPAGLQDIAVLGQPEAHELPALCLGLQTRVDQRLDLGGVASVVRVTDHLVARQPAQQLVDRHTQRLALDVPERNIDRRHRRGQDTLGGEEAAPEELLPDVFDAKGVLADQERLEMLDRTDDGKLPPGEPRLPHTVIALIGVHHDKQEITMPTPDRVGLDIRDPHQCHPFE